MRETPGQFLLYAGPDSMSARLEVNGFARGDAPEGWNLWTSGARERFGDADLVFQSESIEISSGVAGSESVYFGADAHGHDCVSSDPVLAAAHVGGGLERVSLAEDVLFGYRLGRRTIYEGVRRVYPNERLSVGAHSAAVTIEKGEVGAVAGSVHGLIEHVEATCTGDEAIELTGGVDSRLVLALMLAAGRKPRAAFTIGDESTADVIVAKRLAERFGIAHHRVEAEIERDALYEDAERFVRESGFVANASAYGWLPAVYRKLDGIREAQVTGVGGECAGGFYEMKHAGLASKVGAERALLTRRLTVSGNGMKSLFVRGVLDEVQGEIARDVDRVLEGPGSYRERLGRVYLRERVRQWAVPVLRASSAWYEVRAPLLSEAYLAWCAGLPAEKNGRAAQRGLINELCPELAGEPYANELGSAGRVTRRVAKAKKYLKHLVGMKDTLGTGAGQTAHELGTLTEAQGTLGGFLDDHRDLFQAQAARAAMKNPSGAANEFGALLSAAFAQARLKQWQQEPAPVLRGSVDE